jgi:serine/threonine protein kinase
MSDAPQPIAPPMPVEQAATAPQAVAQPAAATPSTKTFTPPTEGEAITSLASKITYIIGSQIGEGHFGIVYSCIDEWNNELAAKVLKPNAPYQEVLAAATEEMQKLYLVRHPFVTYVYDAFEYLWLANCYFSSHRACNIVTSFRRVSAGCTGGR